MDNLRTPCSCGGNNPTCYKCGGWGYLDEVGDGRSTVGVLDLSVNSKLGVKHKPIVSRPQTVKHTRYEKCQHCGEFVTGLSKHLKTVHGITKDMLNGLVVCPKCNCKIKAVKLKAHVAAHHSSK